MFCGEVIFLFLSEFGGGSQCLKCVKFRDTAPFQCPFRVGGGGGGVGGGGENLGGGSIDF